MVDSTPRAVCVGSFGERRAAGPQSALLMNIADPAAPADAGLHQHSPPSIAAAGSGLVVFRPPIGKSDQSWPATSLTASIFDDSAVDQDRSGCGHRLAASPDRRFHSPMCSGPLLTPERISCSGAVPAASRSAASRRTVSRPRAAAVSVSLGVDLAAALQGQPAAPHPSVLERGGLRRALLRHRQSPRASPRSASSSRAVSAGPGDSARIRICAVRPSATRRITVSPCHTFSTASIRSERGSSLTMYPAAPR